MASGEAEPLQYTTTVLRVSIHCEGCKKKVRKVLLAIEGVYKVTIDAAQHKVTVTGSVAADALLRRLLKSGKHAALWPVPAPVAAEAKKEKPEEVVDAPPAGKSGKGADKTDTKLKKVAEEEVEPESSEKKPEKGKSSEMKPEEDKPSEKKAEAKKLKDEAKEGEVPEKKEKGSPEPVAKEANAEEAGGKKGKKKNKQKDAGGDGDAAAAAAAQGKATATAGNAARAGTGAWRSVPVLPAAAGDELQHGTAEPERIVLRAHAGSLHAANAAAGAHPVRVLAVPADDDATAAAGVHVRAAGHAVVPAAGVVQQHVQRGESQLL